MAGTSSSSKPAGKFKKPFTGKLYIGVYGNPPTLQDHLDPIHPVRRGLYWRMLYVKNNDWSTIKSWGPIPLYLHTIPRPETWMIRAGRTCKSRHLLTAVFIADVDSEALLFTTLSAIPLHLDAPNVTEQYVGDVYRRLVHGEATIGAPMSMNWVKVLPDILGFLLAGGGVLMERMVALGAMSGKSSEIGTWGFRSEMWDRENMDGFKVVVYDVLTGAVSEI